MLKVSILGFNLKSIYRKHYSISAATRQVILSVKRFFYNNTAFPSLFLVQYGEYTPENVKIGGKIRRLFHRHTWRLKQDSNL